MMMMCSGQIVLECVRRGMMKDDEYKCSTNAGITMFGPISRQPLSSYSKRFQPGRCLL